jgi:NAD(P)-dependent dehydrogenase (short-subunit alcohol dehydrogenase family)
MEEVNFRGQVAVVTGAGGALGTALCKLLAARGAAVVVNDLGGSSTGEGASRDYADYVVHEIRSAGGVAIANYDTVATERGGRAIVHAALNAFGRVDAVISNAGNQINRMFGEFTADEIDSVLAVHVKGAFFVVQPAYREMVRQCYGRIVLVSSQSGIFGRPFRANYAAAKTAMLGLMNCIAQEAPSGVAVNCLFPNAIGGRLGAEPAGVEADAAFRAAAAQRARHYHAGMDPSFAATMAGFLASRVCTTSQGMYSVLGGKYSRIFVGLSKGWFKAGAAAPSLEDIAGHLQQIDDRTEFTVPRSSLEEMDTAVSAAMAAADNATPFPAENDNSTL